MATRKLPYLIVNLSGAVHEPYQIETVFAANFATAECIGLACYGMTDCCAYVYSPELHKRMVKANRELAASNKIRAPHARKPTHKETNS